VTADARPGKAVGRLVNAKNALILTFGRQIGPGQRVFLRLELFRRQQNSDKLAEYQLVM